MVPPVVSVFPMAQLSQGASNLYGADPENVSKGSPVRGCQGSLLKPLVFLVRGQSLAVNSKPGAGVLCSAWSLGPVPSPLRSAYQQDSTWPWPHTHTIRQPLRAAPQLPACSSGSDPRAADVGFWLQETTQVAWVQDRSSFPIKTSPSSWECNPTSLGPLLAPHFRCI